MRTLIAGDPVLRLLFFSLDLGFFCFICDLGFLLKILGFLTLVKF